VKITIVDFNDSFTWNIFSILKEMDSDLDIVVSHWLEFEVPIESSVVILGPGPGHPDEYAKINSKIRKMIEDDSIYLIGICLGHQLISVVKGYQVMSSQSLVHGQTEQLIIPNWKEVFPKELLSKTVEVQRYNSLSIRDDKNNKSECETLVKKGEIVMMKFKGGVSYQFHPESVGTTCPKSFFRSALNFLYNKRDEHESKSHRII